MYFASSRRSLAKPGSFVGYGRYSSTSRAQRAAFEMPAASNARCNSGTVAVLALTFWTAAAGDAAAAAGELTAAGELAATGEPAVAAGDDAAGELEAAAGELAAAGDAAGLVAAGALVGAAAGALVLAAGVELPHAAVSMAALARAMPRTSSVRRLNPMVVGMRFMMVTAPVATGGLRRRRPGVSSVH